MSRQKFFRACRNFPARRFTMPMMLGYILQPCERLPPPFSRLMPRDMDAFKDHRELAFELRIHSRLRAFCVAYCNNSTGPQNTPAFVQHRAPIRGVQHLHEQYQIEGGILKWKLASFSLHQKRGSRFAKLRLV